MRNYRLSLKILSAAFALSVLAMPLSAGDVHRNHTGVAGIPLAEQVRHELVMLPYYSVFDNLEFDIQDQGTVVLKGQVTRPTLKSDAERAVARLEGVEKVTNDIEVLPLSRVDDRIRLALYRTIYFNTQLDRYALRAVPPIHIIVKNGNVTLVGVVATEADKNIAGILAGGVPGTFTITNDLGVEKRG